MHSVLQIRITLIRILILLVFWFGSSYCSSIWCQSGSLLPNKGSKHLISAQTGSYSIHFGLLSGNWCGSGSSLSLWCGSGSTTLRACRAFIFDYFVGPVNCLYDLCAYQLMEAEEWSVFVFGCKGMLLCMCGNAQQNGWVNTTVGDGIFKLFWSLGIDCASLCSLAVRYESIFLTRFLAPIDCSKIPASKRVHLLYIMASILHIC